MSIALRLSLFFPFQPQSLFQTYQMRLACLHRPQIQETALTKAEWCQEGVKMENINPW